MTFRTIAATAVLLLGSTSGSFAQDKEVVTFMTLDVVNFRGALEEFIAEFEAANPDVDIEPNFTPQLGNQFLPLLQANNLNDITLIFSNAFTPYLSSGRLSPIPEEQAAKYAEILYPESLVPVTREDGVYAVPFNFYPASGVVMYNEALWEEAGIDPNSATTWEEFMELAQQVTKTDASGRITQSGYSAQRNHEHLFLAWLLQLGGTPFNADGTVAFNSPEGVAALQMYADIYQKWKVDSYEFGATIDQFNQGLVASTTVGPWYASILAKDFPNIRVGHLVQPPLPGVAADQPNYWALHQVWAHLVSPAAMEKEGVWRFIDFLLQPEIAARWAEFSGEMPTVQAAQTMPEVLETPFIAPYVEALNYAKAENTSRYLGSDVVSVLRTMLESVAREQASVQDALDTAEVEINRLTARLAPSL